MSTLFTIHSSWYDGAGVFEQLAYASSGDSILLIQDGVLALQSPISLGSFLAKCTAHNIRVHALDEDIKLRGIDSKYSEVRLVNYSGFVDLVVQHDKQVAW